MSNVTTVNACAGLNPEAIPALVEAARRIARAANDMDINAAAYDLCRALEYLDGNERAGDYCRAALMAVRGEK